MGAWFKRGLCGVHLRTQTYAIAVIYIVLSGIALVYGFMLVGDPEHFLGKSGEQMVDEVEKERMEETQSASDEETVKKLESGEIGSAESKHYDTLVKQTQREGVEVVLSSLLTIAFSFLVIIGVHRSRSFLLLPWLVQQSVEILLGTGLLLVYAVSGTRYSFLEVLVFLVSMIVASYFTYSTASYYVLMRTMSRHSAQVISSVMNSEAYSSSGVNYERLQEEIGKEMSTVTPTTTTGAAGAAATATPVTQINQRRDDPFFSID